MNYRRLLIVAALLFIIGILLNLNLPFFKKEQNFDSKKDLALKEAEKIFKECGDKKGERCYSQKLADFTKTHDLTFALQTLSALEDVDPQARGCHLIAHAITLAETSKNPEKWKDILSTVDSQSCSGGFIHGVIEARSRLDSNFVLNAATIPELCFYIAETKGQGGEFNCAHIMGHILMATEDGDIPKSVTICSQLPKKLQYECYSGVFMENETRDNLIAHGLAERIPWNRKTTSEQEALCRQYDGLPTQACWREISHMFAFITGNNPIKTYKECKRAPTKEAVEDCYLHGVGIMISSSKFDVGNIKDVCSPFLENGKDFQECVMHAIGSLMYSSPKFADRVIRLCSEIPEKYQEACFQRLGDRLGTLVSQEERQSLCKGTPQEFKQLCEGSQL